MAEEPLAKYLLVLRYNGGRDTELVTLTHDGVVVRDAVTDGSQGLFTIHYRARRRGPAKIRALFSFIGDRRTDLTLLCVIDGRRQSREIHVPYAEHNWSATAEF